MKLPTMLTVTRVRLTLSGSLRIRPGSTATGVEATLLPSTKVAKPTLLVTVGASLTAAIAIATDRASLSAPPAPLLPPSSTESVSRVLATGVSEPLK
ncbi:hypothetical protein D3C78_1433050 [compost metagenome]